MKKYKFISLKIFTSLLFIYLVFSKVGIRDFLVNLRINNPRLIPFIFLFFIINYFLSALKGKTLLIHQGRDISIKYLFYLYFTGSFFNNFMPTIIGGDVYKVYKLGNKIGHHDNALAVIAMGRIISLFVLVLISLISLLFILGLWGAILLFLYVIFIIVGFYFLSFLCHKLEIFRKIYNILSFYKGHKLIIFKAVILSLFVQIMYVLIQFYLFKMVGINVPLSFAFFILPMIRFIGFFIPSINGFGVQDLLYMELFSLVGIAIVESLCVSVFYHLFKFGISLIGGLLYALDKDD